MALSVLNNIPGLAAQNQLTLTGASLQKTLIELSSGSRINSGADDAAGLAIADGLHANITALTQSARNTNDGIGMLQVADGSLAQVSTLLNRAVTLATEASNGTVPGTQISALNAEYTNILTEIGSIATTTTYNGTAVFGSTASIFMSDGTSTGVNSVDLTTALAALDVSGLGLTSAGFTDSAGAQSELTLITDAIATVASNRGTIGADINQLQAAANVMNNQIQNLTSAEDGIRSADISKDVANLTKYNILQSTGITALKQSNQMQQSVLQLLQ